MNKRLFAASAFVLFVIAANAMGQQSPPAGGASAKEKPASLQKEKDAAVRISVTLVQVDAVVTDGKGQPVTDLKPSDFEIFEDGRRQHITNFSYIATEP